MQSRTALSSYSADEEEVIDALIREWTFFLPSERVVANILALREDLGDNYLDREYESISTNSVRSESDEKAVEVASQLLSEAPKKNGLVRLFSQLAEIIGLDPNDNRASQGDSVALYQSFISETIYDHLAMLARTPRTRRGEPFSIHKELTEGIAEKIGLGLYLADSTSDRLREETERVLLQLAGEYQNWLLDWERQGTFQPTWGNIYATAKEISEEERAARPLLLDADVESAAAASVY